MAVRSYRGTQCPERVKNCEVGNPKFIHFALRKETVMKLHAGSSVEPITRQLRRARSRVWVVGAMAILMPVVAAQAAPISTLSASY